MPLLRRDPLPLPEPENAFDQKVLADIAQYGWHCLMVDDGEHCEHPEHQGSCPLSGPPFAYSVGLWRSHRAPELILTGLARRAHAVLWRVVELIEAREVPRAGDERDDVLEGHRVRFGAVDRRHRKELMTFADWVNGRREFDALQVIYPDREGRWPGEGDYAGPEQPLLDR